jgi:hypothetical protein
MHDAPLIVFLLYVYQSHISNDTQQTRLDYRKDKIDYARLKTASEKSRAT